MLDNRLPAPSPNDFRSYNLNPAVEGAPPVAGDRPSTLAQNISLSYSTTTTANTTPIEYVYIDNSNLFIEAKRVSAVAKGMARDIYEAKHYNVLDHSYSIDFGRLHEFVAGVDKSKIAKAALFGSRPPPNDSIWTFAKRAGFETILVDRNIVNKEKKVDTGIVSAMVKDAYKSMDPANDFITLVAGDGDFVPAIHDLRDDGYSVEVVFWDHASRELKEECSKFIAIDSHLDFLQLKPRIKKR